jgi:hypothetical protein
LLQDRLDGRRVGSQHVSQLGELRVAEEGSQFVDAHLPSGTALRRLALLCGLRRLDALEAGRDAGEEVLDCSFVVVEGSPEGSDALLSGEAHVHELCYLGLVLCVLGGLGFVLLLFLLLLLLLFLLLLLGRLGLGLLLGLGSGLGDLVHADHEVGVLDAYFFDGVVVVEGLTLEDDLEGFGGHPFNFLDFCFEGVDLNEWGITESAGSTSIWNTSPLRFLMFSFITT